MKNLLKNRIVIGLLCIITALIICFGLTPMFNNALTSKVELVRVATEIKAGDQITAGMITTVETGGYNLPPDVVYKKDDVIGKYANADLYKGDYILKSKLSDTPMLKNEYLSGLNGKNRAISITIKSFAAGLSGKLESGDIISLIASDVGESRETKTPDELQYVEVIATTDSKGVDQDVQEQTDTDSKDSEDSELASTITVLATPEQARLLVDLEQNGKLHAALVYRGSSETAQKFLDAQEKVLEKLYPSESEETTDESQNSGSAQASSPAGSSGTVSENTGSAGQG
ncbi:Flp pilus assembly protein CpaB [Caproicibacter fermentans]|uniref:Pilus assembly protein CpaB n=1 Tax=Caproicibacter fermentans TaxID=2576756 RepID=A0A7G8TF40_9FIRM|nr:RcpC/CpaB family pilus assembly protein [Caproicibacter fermentans]QNK42231.1 pilus assembly protein CpaB [Caproicibacter fermentans]